MYITEDFHDILSLFEKHGVRYLIVGGYAFSFHAYPRYTKDLDLLIDSRVGNIRKANEALAEFGSPMLLDSVNKESILQLGVEPNRIDILLKVSKVRFDSAWRDRIRKNYGDIPVNWMDLNCLIRSKSKTGKARHDEDVRVLKEVRKRLKS